MACEAICGGLELSSEPSIWTDGTKWKGFICKGHDLILVSQGDVNVVIQQSNSRSEAAFAELMQPTVVAKAKSKRDDIGARMLISSVANFLDTQRNLTGYSM